MKLAIAVLALVSCVLAGPTLPRLEDNRIVGGAAVQIENSNWQVGLLSRGSPICGGTIISANFVVTAAHCTAGSTAANLSIRAGTSSRTSGGVVVNIAAINQHPQYNSGTIDYDISVMRLATPLTLGATIGVANLPADNSVVASGVALWVTGWGTTQEGGSVSSQLMGVEVPCVSNAPCNTAYGGGITDRMMCAGVTAGGKDACQGDSGGPLVVRSSRTLVGVVSWGYGCARPNYPGVYSSVGNLRSYVRQIAGI